MKNIYGALLLLLIVLCSGSFVSAKETLTVYTVNYPLYYFTERIGGEHVKTVFPAPADVDPAYWKPDHATVSAYQKADFIVLNGAGYAKWISMVSLPRSKTVNTTVALKDRYIKAKAEPAHTHGPAGEHIHETIAFTTWLDFDLAAQQAMTIYKTLCRKKPEIKDVFTVNYNSLKKELESLDRELTAIVAKKPKKPLVGSHPVYQYLSRRYEMNMQSVHWEPGEAPGAAQWKAFQDILKTHPAKWMLWEGDPLSETAEKLSALGLASIVFDPCGNRPEQGDFMSTMRRNIENLKRVYP